MRVVAWKYATRAQAARDAERRERIRAKNQRAKIARLTRIILGDR